MKIIESENLVITSTLESLVFPMLLNFLIGWYLNILNIFKIFDLMLLQDLNTHLGISLLQQNQFFIIFSFSVFAWKLWKRFAWKDNYKMDEVLIFRRWEMIFFQSDFTIFKGWSVVNVRLVQCFTNRVLEYVWVPLTTWNTGRQ